MLLTRLREIWDGDDEAPDAVLLDLSVHDSRHDLAEGTVKALDPTKNQDFRRTVTESVGACAGFGGIGSRTPTAPPDPSLGVVTEMFLLHEWKRLLPRW